MVSQAKVLIATAFTFLVLCAPVQGMLINLTPGQIEEAIEYGKAGKDTKMADFSKEWTVSLGEKVGWATLYSEFHNLAYKARKAVVEKRELFPHAVHAAYRRPCPAGRL